MKKDLKYLEIRELYLQHFKEKDHAVISSASLVPENDPTVLFVNSGMFPLVPFLAGEAHPDGVRLTNSQRCLRTVDFDSVGDETHLTTFEMLGNWSLNDYFKKEAINFTIEFFVEKLGFDIKDIYASVFIGDEDAPKDQDSIDTWKEIFNKYGVNAEVGMNGRIQEFGKSENWWELAGGGPCGPCSEIFFDTGKEKCSDECNVSCSCGKFVEIGNNVFMQFMKSSSGYEPLGRHNVDFGGGLDRLTMLSQGVNSVYETDIFAPVMERINSLTSVDEVVSKRIIADHMKAASLVIMDGVMPGRTEREYILRRLIRRAVRHGKILGISKPFLSEVADVAITQFSSAIPMLNGKREEILRVISEEETKFNNTIEKGLKEFDRRFSKFTQDEQKIFTNEDGMTFMMYETYGFPLEMSLEELERRGVQYDEKRVSENHEKAYIEHQEKSRSATKGLFKGGLADTSEESKKLHTATHLLLRALYNVLGSHVYQKGSNITPERLRLDFPHPNKLTDEELKEVERIVNDAISKSLPVSWIEMGREDALKLVDYAAFEERYGDIVKVYTIGESDSPFSVEICNGPHVQNTSELGKFVIYKQENVGSGIKRIKARLE